MARAGTWCTDFTTKQIDSCQQPLLAIFPTSSLVPARAAGVCSIGEDLLSVRLPSSLHHTLSTIISSAAMTITSDVPDREHHLHHVRGAVDGRHDGQHHPLGRHRRRGRQPCRQSQAGHGGSRLHHLVHHRVLAQICRSARNNRNFRRMCNLTLPYTFTL